MHKLRNIKIVSILIVGIGLTLLPIKTRLLISSSDSLPYKTYFLVKGGKFNKNDFVGISGFVTTYTEDKHFTKRIIGVHGDLITVVDDKVLINGEPKVTVKAKTKDHRKLTPISSQMIHKDYYFVVADHIDSFDSRYQEFGLVKGEYIEGKAYPLW